MRAVVLAQRQLDDDGAVVRMDQLRQPLVLGDQLIARQTRHAFKIMVVVRRGGETRDDGADAACGKTLILRDQLFAHMPVLIGKGFPGCRADQAVFQTQFSE